MPWTGSCGAGFCPRPKAHTSNNPTAYLIRLPSLPGQVRKLIRQSARHVETHIRKNHRHQAISLAELKKAVETFHPAAVTDNPAAGLAPNFQTIAIIVERRSCHAAVEIRGNHAALVEGQRPPAKIVNRREQRSSARGNRHIDVIGVSQTLPETRVAADAMRQNRTMRIGAGVVKTEGFQHVLEQKTAEGFPGYMFHDAG